MPIISGWCSLVIVISSFILLVRTSAFVHKWTNDFRLPAEFLFFDLDLCDLCRCGPPEVHTFLPWLLFFWCGPPKVHTFLPGVLLLWCGPPKVHTFLPGVLIFWCGPPKVHAFLSGVLSSWCGPPKVHASLFLTVFSLLLLDLCRLHCSVRVRIKPA